ncbi:solute carrier family 40 member chloroplastic [Chlorella sorokiniana]|uniref:Solute carrier family 40 member chloroplastic n=1 Tax=Chlorella sorokiniana TaxID=3076 RepID=A0A2P6TJ30_CHLSO|nr:solute carrier family 40 member chloroplastic [Chlorella sorokiniana]|eukprot:PRW39229.1 solute carrier family 40 member chloroplastic [Chlorella sorokiniana]
MSPPACIAAQLGALQRNDWPEQDAGVQTAFMFAMPQGAEELLAAQAPPQRVRSWGAREEWLSMSDFSNALHSSPYALLLNCDSWRPCSPLVFPSRRHQDRAVAAIEVVAAAPQRQPQQQQQQDGRLGQQQAGSDAGQQQRQQRQTFTWCLERVQQGPLKNCWLTVGVRQRWQQQRAGQAQRLGTAVCSLPTVAASGGAGDHADASGERALHPTALTALYTLYAFACFVERTWRFGLPLVLAFVEGGFQAIAILGFVAPLACSLAGPAVGRMLDSVYRPLGLGAMLALQDGAIALSSLALIAVARSGASGPLASSPLFGLLVVLAMLEKLASISSELAIERDWVTQLAGKQNQGALARSNAYLRRTDLVTELVGAVVFGWIYSKAGLVSSMAFTAVLAALAAPLQLFFINRIAHLAPSAMLHGRQEPGAAWAPLPSWRSFVENARLRRVHAAEEAARRAPLLARLQQQAAHALDGWRSYFAQPILPSSLTCVLLFFNVVLSPGGLITAFLTSRGFDGNAMAAFRGGCATCGFLGTIVGKRLIQSLGLLRAGAAALLIQATLLFGATVLYTTLLSVPASLGAGAAGGVGLLLGAGAAAAWPTVGGIALPVVLFAALVVASRIGVWSYDMVNSQLFQQTVAPREIASASSAEMALCSFSELFMLGIAAVYADPASFPLLVYASFGAVVCANLLFRSWARRAQPTAAAELAGPDALLQLLCTGAGAGGGGLALLCGPWAALQFPLANVDVTTFAADWAGFNTQFSWSFTQLVVLHYQWPFPLTDPALAGTLGSRNVTAVAEALSSLITTDSLKQAVAVPNLPSPLPPDYSPSYTGEELGSLAPVDEDLEPPPSDCPLILCKTCDAAAAACAVFDQGGEQKAFPGLPTARLQASNGADAVVAWNASSLTANIVWLGSEEKIDWFMDAILFFSDDFRPGNLSGIIPGVKVHKGFLNQFESFTTKPESDQSNITAVLLGMSAGTPPQRIVAAGHSLGAALRTPAYFGSAPPAAASFSAGDDQWELEFTATVGRAYRYVNHLDQVPTLPPFDSFKQVPHGLWLRDNLVLLQSMPASLEALQLEGPRLPAGTLAAVLRHTGLQRLQIYCFADGMEDPRPLTALQQLTELRLHCGGSERLVAPQPCQFPAGLARYALFREEPWEEDGENDAIREIEVAGALLGGVHLVDQHLTIESMSSLTSLTSLPRLLAALLPAGQSGFARLNLSVCTLPLEALQPEPQALKGSSAQLPLIAALSLVFCDVTGGSFSDALTAMHGSMPHLKLMGLQGCLFEETIPQLVLSSARLTSLLLGANNLQALPEARALEGLINLDLRANCFTRLPSALSTATALTSLNLTLNDGLHLLAEDLPVLQRMVSLAELALPAAAAESAPAALRGWLGPRLRVV